jgi:hypothetical protein
MTKDIILDKLYRDPMIDEMIWNITGGNPLKEDLKSELFLILMEMPDSKIIGAWKDKWINYLCVNILTKQWRSSTSPFYKKFKKERTNEEFIDIIDEEVGVDWELAETILDIADKHLTFVEKELFMMRYKIGKYDRWFGEWRDKECQKPIYSYRKIEKKLAIGTSGGKPITIDHSTVEVYHKRSIEKIRKILNKIEKNI